VDARKLFLTKVPPRQGEMGKRERGNFACPSATKSVHPPGRSSRGIIGLFGFPAYQKLLYLEFVELFGS